jgi:predicted acetyltransferase
MRLVLPSLKYKNEYLQALKETEGEIGETRLNKPDTNQTFEDFVKMWKDHAKGRNHRNGAVPATMYWLIDKNEVIGRVHLRHILNDFLLNYGGHIGYYIKPSKRRMGYGKKILELALVKAKKMGIWRVLLTCDDNNIGSQKVIESFGGVLENIVQENKHKPLKKRYWIKLSPDVPK